METAKVREGGLVSVVLPTLPEGSTVEVIIRSGLPVEASRRVFGSASGQGRMSEDFEAPPYDFRDYM